MSGMIYAVIVVMWAAFLVPMWLRRHDDAAEAKSVDRFASKMRILARRTGPEVAEAPPAPRPRTAGAVLATAGSRPRTVSSTVRIMEPSDAHATDDEPTEIVTQPARETRVSSTVRVRPAGAVPSTPAEPVASRRPERQPPRAPAKPKERWAAEADNAAMAELARPDRARDLARDSGRGIAPASLVARRRRLLIVVGAATLLLILLGLLNVVPLWTTSLGWLALVGYLVHLRVQARRAADIARRRARAARTRPPVDDVSELVSVSRRPRRTAATDLPENPFVHADEPVDEDAWRPVSVPVPTYVTAPKAARVVRRIELGGEQAWTSGRMVPDAAAASRSAAAAAHLDALAAQTSEQSSDEESYDAEVPRAVGD